jgi:hypothetical protein
VTFTTVFAGIILFLGDANFRIEDIVFWYGGLVPKFHGKDVWLLAFRKDIYRRNVFVGGGFNSHCRRPPLHGAPGEAVTHRTNLNALIHSHNAFVDYNEG